MFYYLPSTLKIFVSLSFCFIRDPTLVTCIILMQSFVKFSYFVSSFSVIEVIDTYGASPVMFDLYITATYQGEVYI